MSSPDVESPFSTYSYPSEVTLSTPQTSSEALPSPRTLSSEQRIPPRLRSPDLFREIFGIGRHGQSPAFSASLDRPAINYMYQETMNDVNRAIQSANRAIQSAQEAFQSRRSLSRNNPSRQEIVDLTGTSPPPPPPPPAAPLDFISPSGVHNTIAADDAAYDAFISRLTHPRDIQSRHTDIPPHFHPAPHAGYGPQFDEDPTSRYTGPDSLAGPRRRFEYQQRPNLSLFGMQRTMMRPGNRASSATEDDAAIRRQRVARAQWEDNRRRNAERQRLAEGQRLADQRQRVLSSSRVPGSVPSQRSDRHNPDGARRPSTRDSNSSVEAVDLTQVEDEPSLAAALSKQTQDAIQSQNESSQNKVSNSGIGSEGGRTALTAYKCPICMESPQNATTTSCGHLFCHKCIIDTLKWSEQARRDEAPPSRKVRGVCPVCRKELARKEEPGHGRTLIPLEIKLMTKADLKRKHDEIEAAAAEAAAKQRKESMQSKGKGKVYDISNYNDDDNENNDTGNDTGFKMEEDLDHYGDGQAHQRSRDAKKIKTQRADSLEMDSLFDFGYDEMFS